MKPWEAAKKWQDEHSEVPFEVLLGEYFKHGCVWSSDGSFLLAKEAHWNGEDLHSGDAEKNCWVVQLASGVSPMKKFMKIAPTKREFVAWQRRGSQRWHVWPWNQLKRKIYKNG